MLPALPTGRQWMSGASPSASTISKAAVFCPSTGRVDRVDQRDRIVGDEFAGQLQAVVEVALDLQQPGAVHERLRQLAHRDLAAGHSTAQVIPARTA